MTTLLDSVYVSTLGRSGFSFKSTSIVPESFTHVWEYMCRPFPSLLLTCGSICVVRSPVVEGRGVSHVVSLCLIVFVPPRGT